MHWAPPAGALDLATEVIRDRGISAYGPCAGLPALAGALREKLSAENGLSGVSTLHLSAHSILLLPVHTAHALTPEPRAGLPAYVTYDRE